MRSSTTESSRCTLPSKSCCWIVRRRKRRRREILRFSKGTIREMYAMNASR